jgi:RNA polymerase sigma-70 factor (ECF subfamily)
MLSDRGEAQDAVQDTFVLAWRRLPSLLDPEAFRAWIYKLMTRRCLNILRVRLRQDTGVSSGPDLELHAPAGRPARASSTTDPAAVAHADAMQDSLTAVLATLPPDQRACWVLHEMHELTYPALAAATGIPVSTVRGRIARARLQLGRGMAGMAVTGPTPTSPSQTEPNWLGCGRSIDDIWARVDLPSDPHEQTCPDCQAARHDLGDLAAATRVVVAADKADPALRLNSGAITDILENARAEVRRSRRIPMEQPRPGAAGDELTVSEQALANLIRRTSDEIDGLEARRSAVALSKHNPLYQGAPRPRTPQPETIAAPTDITVDLRISVAPTVTIPALTRLLRDQLRTAIELEVGIAATVINITVEDIHHV